jgi:hypothetical protein
MTFGMSATCPHCGAENMTEIYRSDSSSARNTVSGEWSFEALEKMLDSMSKKDIEVDPSLINA